MVLDKFLAPGRPTNLDNSRARACCAFGRCEWGLFGYFSLIYHFCLLSQEVEIAVASLKKGKSAGVDNIPAELVQAGGETMIDVLTEICNRIWRTGEWPTPWTQSLIITLPKKGNLQLCQNYRTISLISHSSKVMLKVILNRLKPQAEEIIAEEQAGFRAGRSTTEQIFNLRILCEKYLQHQQNLYHVFIDFKNL